MLHFFTVLAILWYAHAAELDREVERQLAAPTNAEFVNVPFRQVLEDLRLQSGISLVLDEPAMEEAGIDLDRPCSVKLEGISLASVLFLIAHQAKLTVVVEGGVVLISTQQKLATWIVERTYPVSDLVKAPGDEEPGWACASVESRDRLLRLVTNSIATESWSDNGGIGDIRHDAKVNALVITHSVDVQNDVRELLEILRRLGPDDRATILSYMPSGSR